MDAPEQHLNLSQINRTLDYTLSLRFHLDTYQRLHNYWPCLYLTPRDQSLKVPTHVYNNFDWIYKKISRYKVRTSEALQLPRWTPFHPYEHFVVVNVQCGMRTLWPFIISFCTFPDFNDNIIKRPHMSNFSLCEQGTVNNV